METQNKTLTRRRAKTVDPRTPAELRLRDALILLRLYMRNSPHLKDLNARTARWFERHGKIRTHAGREFGPESRQS